MHVSKNGLDLIKKYEGFYAKAYICPGGVLTIGYGTTNSDSSILNYTIKKDSVITKTKAEEFLKKSIEKKYEPNVNKYMSTYNFNQNQYDALCSFCYNIGSIDQLVGRGSKSITKIANDILLYNHAGGKELKGLTRRRKEEQQLFNTPVYENNKNINKNTVKYSVNVDYLYVRSGASTKFKIIRYLKKKQKVDIVDYVNGWGKIANTNSWVNLKYCKRCNAIVNTISKSNIYVVKSNGLNVRNGAGVNYKIVNILSNGDELYIDKKNGTWGRITNTNNWVNLKYCRKVG